MSRGEEKQRLEERIRKDEARASEIVDMLLNGEVLTGGQTTNELIDELHNLNMRINQAEQAIGLLSARKKDRQGVF